MTSLTPKQQRQALLVALYDEKNGSTSTSFKTETVAESIRLDPARAGELVVVLKNGGYVEALTFGGTGFLIARGISEAERLKVARPVVPQSVIAVTLSNDERGVLEAFVGDLERAAVADQLVGDDLLEYQSDLISARAQSVSPRPKRTAVRVVVARLVEVSRFVEANATLEFCVRLRGTLARMFDLHHTFEIRWRSVALEDS